MSTLNLDSEKQAKLKELENQLKAAQDRLALIAEKYLDGDLSKEEKLQLSQKYSGQISQLREQIKGLLPDKEESEQPAINESNHIPISSHEREGGEVSHLPHNQNRQQPPKRPSRIKAIFKLLLVYLGLVAIVFLLLFGISSAISYSNSKKYEKEQEYVRSHPSNYTKLKQALKDGTVHRGMTYKQITEIVGGADSVSKTDGDVKYANYFPSNAESGGHYSSSQIQLCFRDGVLSYWNEE